MPSTQIRSPLLDTLQQHANRAAGSLIARQFTDSLTESQAFPDLKDSALVDSTAGAVNITLPEGSDDITGLPYYVRKTDVSANAAGMACAGSDTFASGATSLTTTTQGAEVGAMWDGTHWIPLPSSGGSVSVASVTTTGAVTAGTTMAAGTGASIGGDTAGTADATLSLNKTAGGVAGVTGKVVGVKRFELLMDGSENLILRNYAADGTTVLGSLTLDNTTGLLTSLLGLVIASGGLSVSAGNIVAVLGNIAASAGTVTGANGLVATAGGLTVNAGGATIAGGLDVTSGIAKLPLLAFPDDAAAGAAGLVTGNLYLIGQTVTSKI